MQSIQLYISEIVLRLGGFTQQTQQVATELNDSNATFISSGVKQGYEITNTNEFNEVFTATIVSVDSETKLTLSNTIYGQGDQQAQYVIIGKNTDRVDMFKDESVSITQSIQNVKDIAKVFTEFTKTFTLPASKTNNKIFKHYYNFDITGGFDARTKKDATLELNYLPFKKGKIKLEGVDLQNRRPKSYRITFFGNTVTLKDLLGEDKLNSLSSLNSLNETFSSSEIKSALQRNPASNDVVVPIITHTKRLYYDSVSHIANSGNLFNHTGGGSHNHGLAWNELKYALRLHEIVKAIELKYDITFSTDFFSTSNDAYYDLFMWLHRKKGIVSSGGQLEQSTKLINGWSTASGGVSEIINSSTLLITDANLVNNFTLSLTRTTSTPYDISITRNGTEIYAESEITSTSKSINLYSYVQDGAQYSVTLTYASALSFTSIEYEITYNLTSTESYDTGSFSAPADFEFVITEQIPEIKVIDFLTGLFKMFNLTTFVEEDGTIYVDDLDSFYANKKSISTAYDISEFVDVKSSQVNVALPYREVSFSYEDTDTFLAATHNQLFNQEWAKTDYTQTDDDGNIVDGGLYSVVAPFGHPKYERLVDLDTESQTDIQWGYSVDDNQESYIGKPLLFYPVYTNPSEVISFIDIVNPDGTYGTHSSISGSVNMPSNSVSFSSGTSTANINFKLEKNEYTGDSSFTGTLFESYYSNYITDVFNTKNRITKVKAYLPLRILLNFTLADRFDINGKRYKINSIETNLATGESNIELLNEL